MKKQIPARLEIEIIEKLKVLADKENLTTSAYIQKVLKDHVRERLEEGKK